MENSARAITAFLLLSITVPTAYARFFHWRSRTKSSGSCDRKITQEGRFQLTGLDQPSPFKFPPYCALKILSRANMKIKLSFQNPASYQCSKTSFVAVLNGWLMSDGVGGSLIPESRDAQQIRQKLICVDDGVPTPQVFESSRNLAEIFYKLHPGQAMDVLVNFLPQNQSCDVVLDDEDAGKEFVMDTKGKAGVCRWYLPGGVMINIHEISLVAHGNVEDTEAKCHGNRLLVKSGDSFRSLLTYKTVCTPHDMGKEIPTYCKQTVLELHSADTKKRQFVKFSFRFFHNMFQVLARCSK